MALFKNKGDNLSRAGQIISDIKPNKEDVPTPVETPEVETPEVETPVVETPEVETPVLPVKNIEVEIPPVEPVQPATEETIIKPDVPLQPEAPQITDEAMYDYLSEKLNRKIENVDDLTVREEMQLDPEVKQLLEWKEKTGLSLSKWSDYNKDFSKMGDLDVAREILSQQYPNFTKAELDYSLKDYIFDEDMDDESDKMKKGIALKRYAQDGRQELEANQLKLISSEGQTLTSQQQKDLDAYAKIQGNQGSAEANQAQYVQDISKAAMSLEAINLQLSDDLAIKYDVSEGERRTLSKTVTEMPHWYNTDGSLNHAEVVQDGLKIRDFDTIVKKAFEQGLTVGQESKIKADNNITLDLQTPPARSEEGQKKGNIDKVIDNIAGKGTKKSKFRFRTLK
jgi:hypothetical protein